MRKLTLGLLAVLTCLAMILPLAAQEGFPLKGSWLGDWGESTTNRNQVFVVFDWDGKVISGAINPGTDTIAVRNASLTPTPVAPPPGAAAAAGGGAGQGGGGGRGGGGRGGGNAAAAGAPAAAGGATTPVPALPAAPAAAGAAAPAAGAGAGGQGGRGGGLGGNGAGTSAAAPVEWVVHFEGDGKDAKGATVHYVADGKIENIGLSNRSIAGTWVSGTAKGTFRITRQ